MISKLNISDFRLKLKENTLQGNPKIKGTPFVILTAFDSTEKIFYGKFDKSKFQLTKNSAFFSIPYIINGNFKSTNKSGTAVSYKIKPIWFGYLWLRILPILVLLFFNIVIVPKDNEIDMGFLISINAILGIFFIPALITINMKKELVKKFKLLFEIIEKDKI